MIRISAVLALVIICFVVPTGCATYTSTRSREISSRFVTEVGSLKSETPVESEIESVSIDVVGIEGSPEPFLAVKIKPTRRYTYEAIVMRREIVKVRHARAVYIIRQLPHQTGWIEGGRLLGIKLGCILGGMFGMVFDLFVPFTGQLHAFSGAGDALDTLDDGTVKDIIKEEKDAGCIVSVHETEEVGDLEETDETRRVSKTVARPEPGIPVTVCFAGTPGLVKVRTDPAGVARVPIASLAAILNRADWKLSELVIECAGRKHRHAIDEPLLVAMLRATIGPPPVVSGPDKAGLSGPARRLLDEGIRAEARLDLPAAVRAYGTLMAQDLEKARALGLTRKLPRILSKLGGPPAVPATAIRVAREAMQSIAGLADEDDRESVGDDVQEQAQAVIAAAPWWSTGHRIRAAAYDLLGRRQEAARSLEVALALTAEGSDEAGELRGILVRWKQGSR
jgi:hypothetical protein